MSILKASLFLIFILVTTIGPAGAEIKVVASIKPVHSLVSAVMEGVYKPDLIVTGASSPHNFSLKPSQAQVLEKADLVFWIGRDLETFLVKPIISIALNARSVELIKTERLNRLTLEGGHTHTQHNHAEHSDHAEHSEFDVHIWLDPENAKVLVKRIVIELSIVDPENAATYEINGNDLVRRLSLLTEELEIAMSGLGGRNFITFHSAYRYFTERFGLSAAESIVVLSEVLPGADRIRKIRDTARRSHIACVLAEPQYESNLVPLVTEGTEIQIGMIDPLGAMLEDGPQLYFALLRNVAESIRACLLPTG